MKSNQSDERSFQSEPLYFDCVRKSNQNQQNVYRDSYRITLDKRLRIFNQAERKIRQIVLRYQRSMIMDDYYLLLYMNNLVIEAITKDNQSNMFRKQNQL